MKCSSVATKTQHSVQPLSNSALRQSHICEYNWFKGASQKLTSLLSAYIKYYVHTFVACTYVCTMLHLLKYWSALVSCAAPHLPLLLHNYDWIVNREGRGWRARLDQDQREKAEPPPLMHYSNTQLTEGVKCPMVHWFLGSPAGWSPSWVRHGVHCPPPWQSPSLSAVTSHEEVRGNERTKPPAAVVPGIHELQRSVQSTAMNTLWIPWNKQNLRYACMAHGTHQSNRSPWYSTPCTHAVPLVTAHCMITRYLSIQSWMGSLQHKGKVTFSKTWRGNVISLFITGQTCLLTNTYVLTAHSKSTMNIGIRDNDIHCIL